MTEVEPGTTAYTTATGSVTHLSRQCGGISMARDITSTVVERDDTICSRCLAARGRPGADELREMYHDRGMTLKEIGKRYGYAPTAVLGWMNRAGIEREHRTGAANPKLSDAEWLEARIREGLTHREIAGLAGSTESAVGNWVRDLGLTGLARETRGPPGDLAELYHGRGMTYAEIAEREGVGTTTVKRWADADPDIIPRGHGGGGGGPKERPGTEALRDMYWGERLTLAEIGELLGVTDRTAKQWLNDAGVPTTRSRPAPNGGPPWGDFDTGVAMPPWLPPRPWRWAVDLPDWAIPRCAPRRDEFDTGVAMPPWLCNERPMRRDWGPFDTETEMPAWMNPAARDEVYRWPAFHTDVDIPAWMDDVVRPMEPRFSDAAPWWLCEDVFRAVAARSADLSELAGELGWGGTSGLRELLDLTGEKLGSGLTFEALAPDWLDEGSLYAAAEGAGDIDGLAATLGWREEDGDLAALANATGVELGGPPKEPGTDETSTSEEPERVEGNATNRYAQMFVELTGQTKVAER